MRGSAPRVSILQRSRNGEPCRLRRRPRWRRKQPPPSSQIDGGSGSVPGITASNSLPARGNQGRHGSSRIAFGREAYRAQCRTLARSSGLIGVASQFQTFAVASTLPVTMREPSGLKLTEVTRFTISSDRVSQLRGLRLAINVERRIILATGPCASLAGLIAAGAFFAASSPCPAIRVHGQRSGFAPDPGRCSMNESESDRQAGSGDADGNILQGLTEN